MEQLDIVDENNNLTGQRASRREIHAKGIGHRTVGVYLFRQKSNEIELLVHLRSVFKDLHPNRWDTKFGGHIKAGSSVELTIQEELKDEIGILVDKNFLIEGQWYKKEKFSSFKFSKIFYLNYQGPESELKFNDGEVQKVKWMKVSDIKAEIEKHPDLWAGSLQSFNRAMDYLLDVLEKRN